MQGLGLQPNALDALDIQGRRKTLLDVAKLESPTLSVLGGSPSDEAIFVLDTGDSLFAACEEDSLVAFARSNYLDVSEPRHVAGTDEFDAAPRWEIRLLAGGSDAGALASGDTPGQARARMVVALKDLAGDRVLPLGDWARAQQAGSLEVLLAAPKTLKRREPQWGSVETVHLQPLPVAPGNPEEGDQPPQKVRRKEAFGALAEPAGLRFAQDLAGAGAALMRCAIRAVRYDGQILANQHDLMAAARMGFDIGDLVPHPTDVAHRFLISEETRRAMRRRGYVELTDFDPAKVVRLRTSLPEFSEAVTGEATQVEESPEPQKPEWPPASNVAQRVVIVLDRARLACDVEPEYERVVIRDIIDCAGRLWVAERHASDQKCMAARSDTTRRRERASEVRA